MHQQQQQSNSEAMFRAAAYTYQSLKQNALPLDIATDSTDKLAIWFQSRLPFPFHMANSGIASDVMAQYRPVGGRLLVVGDEPIALVAFSMSNDVITMLVGPEHLMEASGDTVIQSAGIVLHSHNEGSLHFVTWNNRGLIYVLTSTRSMGNAQQCTSCHKDNATTSVAVSHIPTGSNISIPAPNNGSSINFY
jgi:hypothetical protein